MSRAIRVHEAGGPENMQIEDVALAAPTAGEVLVRQSMIGVNFIDCYHRSGLYPLPLPLTPGIEGIGEVVEIGDDVSDLRPGDRVCYGTGPAGGYAEARLIDASRLVKVPTDISDQQLGGCLVRGLTVWYLTHELRQLQPGETVLFHAAAGGVGLIFCQWAKALGVKVIGTTGSHEKAELAKANGCDHVVVLGEQNFVESVRDLTSGRGVQVVYDGIGKDTFHQSLDCLERRGLMVSFGNASGPPPAIDIGSLGPLGSLFVTRPTLFDYTSTHEELARGMSALFAVISSGQVKNHIGQSYPLEQAATAHRDLENRRTTGSTVLLP